MNKKRRALIYSLEQRILLDGAIAADAAQALSDIDHRTTESSDETVQVDAIAPTQSQRREVVFIDASLPDYQTLVDGVPEDAEVYLIEAGVDGFEFMAETLADQTDIDAIHIIGHGASGEALLGSATLNTETLQNYSQSLTSIGQSLSNTGDILLYGCNVALDKAGEVFVEELANLTQADIAASIDVTGMTGDWGLEHVVGSLDVESLSYADYDNDLATSGTATFEIRVKSLDSSKSGVVTDSQNVTWSYTNNPSSVSGGSLSTDALFDGDGADEQFWIKASGLPDGTTWTVSITGSGAEGGGSFSGTGNKTSYFQTGDYKFTVDGNETWSINLGQSPNSAPSAGTNGSITINPGNSISSSNLTKSNTNTSDSDGDSLSFSLSGGTVSAPTESTYRAYVGSVLVGTQSFSVSDGKGGTDTGSVKVYAVYNDDPATWNSSQGNVTWSGSGTLSQAHGDRDAVDPDTSNPSTYTSVENSSWATASGFTVSGNAAPENAGEVITVTTTAYSSNNVGRDPTQSYTITLTSVAANLNDAPTTSNSTLTAFDEDTTHAFSATEFKFSDLDTGASAANTGYETDAEYLGATLNKIKITSLPNSSLGILKLNGAVMSDVSAHGTV